MTAFHGDVSVKEAFLEWVSTVEAFGPEDLPPQRQQGFDPAVLADVTARFAIDPGLLIAAHKLRTSREDTRALFEALAPGANTRIIAQLLMLWTFEAATPSLQDWIKDEELHGWAKTVMAMHRRVLEGEEIPSREWKARRNAMPKVDDLGQLGAAEAVRASAWNLVLMPGAWEDFFTYWFLAGEAVVQGAGGWTLAETQAEMSIVYQRYAEVTGAENAGADEASRAEIERATRAVSAASEQMMGRVALIQQSTDALRTAGSEKLLSLVREAPAQDLAGGASVAAAARG